MPESLSGSIETYLSDANRDKESHVPLTIARIEGPGSADYNTFLFACHRLIGDFANLESSQMLQLRLQVLTDPDFANYRNTDNDLSLMVEYFLWALLDEKVEVYFGTDPYISNGLSEHLDIPEDAHFTTGMMFKKTGELEKVVFVIPEGSAVEMGFSPEAQVQYYSSIVGMSFVTSQCLQQPERYGFHMTREKWKTMDGPGALINLSINSAKGFALIMQKNLWSPDQKV